MWVRRGFVMSGVVCLMACIPAEAAGRAKGSPARQRPKRTVQASTKTAERATKTARRATKSTKQGTKTAKRPTEPKVAKQTVIKRAVKALEKADEDYSLKDISLVLSTMKFESSFDPYADAPGSTALGLLQWLLENRLRLCRELGISPKARFTLEVQLKILPEWIEEMFDYAEKKVGSKRTERFYEAAYSWHRWGRLRPAGQRFFRAKVLPEMKKIQRSLGA